MINPNHLDSKKGVPFKYPFAFFTKPTDVEYIVNCYVDLKGVIRPRHNPTVGLYYFDGQIFYKRKSN